MLGYICRRAGSRALASQLGCEPPTKDWSERMRDSTRREQVIRVMDNFHAEWATVPAKYWRHGGRDLRADPQDDGVRRTYSFSRCDTYLPHALQILPRANIIRDSSEGHRFAICAFPVRRHGRD